MACKKQYPFGMDYCPSCGSKLVIGKLRLKPVSEETFRGNQATSGVKSVAKKICVLCGKQIAFHEESYILNCQDVCKHCYETEGSWLDVVLNENPNLTGEELWEKKKEVGERPFKTADEQGKRSARSIIWALGQVVAGGLILASEIWFWILLFSGNFAAIGGLSIQNLLPLVVETPVAIFVAIAMIVGGASYLRSKKIGESTRERAIEALCEHLRRMGLNATVESKKFKWREVFVPVVLPLLGSVRVVNRNIDLVELEGRTREEFRYWEYGSGFRCNYIVQAKVNGLEERLEAKLDVVEKGLRREFVDFKWKGRELAQVLNGDANLRTTRYGSLEIKPDKKHQRVRIREISAIGLYYATPELAFPSIETFEAYDRIAHHIRSIANVRR